jgi:hypothetical protein
MTPREFLDVMVRPNVDDFHARFGDVCCAFNAVMAVDALAAHIFVWLQGNSPSEVAGLGDDTHYRGKLAASHERFRLLRDIAKAQKHVRLTRGNPVVTRASQVSERAIGWGEGAWGKGRWGGPPQVVVDMDDDDGSFFYLEGVVDDALGCLEAEMGRLGL